MIQVPHLIAQVIERYGDHSIRPADGGEFCVFVEREGGMVQGTSRYARTLRSARMIAKRGAQQEAQ